MVKIIYEQTTNTDEIKISAPYNPEYVNNILSMIKNVEFVNNTVSSTNSTNTTSDKSENNTDMKLFISTLINSILESNNKDKKDTADKKESDDKDKKNDKTENTLTDVIVPAFMDILSRYIESGYIRYAASAPSANNGTNPKN